MTTLTTRRSLLRATAAGIALSPLLVEGEAFAASSVRRNLYTRKRFAVLRHRAFRLEADGRRWSVRLSKVGNLPNCARKAEHAFSLTFRAGRSGPPQGSYVLSRRGFAPTTLFVVPSDRGRRTYEAVIFRKP